MKKIIAPLLFLGILVTAGCRSNTATESEDEQKKEEWVSLFNGKDINDWMVKIHHHEFGENYGNTFRVRDSTIQVRYDQYGDFNDQFGHLYYKIPYAYYHLKLAYRFVGELQKGAPSYTLRNSGVMFHSQDPRTMPKEQDWPISVEMQFLGGLGDGKPRPTGNMCSPGTHVVYKGKIADSHCLNSTSKTYDGDQWVHAELIVLGDSLVTHIIEGDTVLQYAKPQIGGDVAHGYDPTIKVDGKLLKSGYIALQSEGQPVDFKHIEIKDLSSVYKK
ncbi:MULTISPECIES: 3-keto-disaccharide hydrolase [Sphingobacteriaceae]|uniref:3-keto-alpha-glucoside-1,2-lyase/3-keto-2-hydroxy-glucal hydratase domain-containing protein n=1 Tax=Sphingobacterium sp. (strain 21) TaxID=743722 RepID=F4C1X8_SPHS2